LLRAEASSIVCAKTFWTSALVSDSCAGTAKTGVCDGVVGVVGVDELPPPPPQDASRKAVVVSIATARENNVI